MPEISEVFRSDDLLVRRVGGYDSASCVVTFDSYTDRCTLDRLGFAEDFLRNRAIDAVHVISRDNDWYQYPAMQAAMETVHAATRGYDRVVTYGSSMGAYAAIRFAGLVGADCAFACSPQFSIDPTVVRFEYRWVQAARVFRPVWEGLLPFPALREAYIAYDPVNLDAKHISLIRRGFRFTPLRLPGAGHPVTGFLQEVDVLERLVMSIIRGDTAADVLALVDEARSRREQSAQYFCQRAADSWRRSRKIAFLEKAVQLAPGHGDIRGLLARQLEYAGRFDDAAAAYETALQHDPEHANVLLHYSLAMERQGNLGKAIELAERALAISGNVTLYEARIAFMRRHLGRAPRRRWHTTLRDVVRRAIMRGE